MRYRNKLVLSLLATVITLGAAFYSGREYLRDRQSRRPVNKQVWKEERISQLEERISNVVDFPEFREIAMGLNFPEYHSLYQDLDEWEPRHCQNLIDGCSETLELTYNPKEYFGLLSRGTPGEDANTLGKRKRLRMRYRFDGGSFDPNGEPIGLETEEKREAHIKRVQRSCLETIALANAIRIACDKEASQEQSGEYIDNIKGLYKQHKLISSNTNN
jgi:hypothetical protein